MFFHGLPCPARANLSIKTHGKSWSQSTDNTKMGIKSSNDDQDPYYDNMSPFFPCEIDDAIQYINLGYGAQAPKIVNHSAFFRHFVLFLSFRSFFVILASYFQGLLNF